MNTKTKKDNITELVVPLGILCPLPIAINQNNRSAIINSIKMIRIIFSISFKVSPFNYRIQKALASWLRITLALLQLKNNLLRQ